MPPFSELQDHREPAAAATSTSFERIVVFALIAHAVNLEAAWLVAADGAQPLAITSDGQAGALEVTAQRYPDDPMVCFVESPGRTIARLAGAGVGEGDTELLKRWADSASSMLRRRHRSPDRTLLVDASDLEQAAEDVRAHLEARLGAGMAITVVERAAAPDPLAEWLGHAIAAARPEVEQLWNELQVSCELIRTAATAAPAGADLAAAAFDHYRRWIEERASLSARLRAADERVGATEDELARARAALTTAQDAHAGLRDALELEQLRTQQALEEIGTLAARARQAEDELTRSKLSTTEALRLVSERDASLQSTLQLLDQTQRLQLDGAARLDRVQHDLIRLRCAHRSIVGLPCIEPPACRELKIIGFRDETPHRELVVLLRDVDSPNGLLKESQMRLVEHEGHPGFAFFTTGQEHVLRQWQPDGEESGHAFMLLIPGDDAGARRLARLGTADWRFVLGMAQRLRSELADPRAPWHGRWYPIAARLYLALCELPPRWRYDRVEARMDAADNAMQALEVAFGDVCFGREPLGDVQIRWRRGGTAGAVGAAEATLEWLCPRGAAAPLSAWPLDGDGRWNQALTIPVGAAFPTSLKYRWWAALPAGDCERLLALLDALPAAAALPTARDAVPMLTPQAATALHREARRLLMRYRLRQTLRRTMGGRQAALASD